MNRNIKTGLMDDSLLTKILMRTAAASDARMGGASLPAMTNSGSGNQGIAATMPVVVVAEHIKANDEALTRALILSHMMAIYIHDKLPKLSKRIPKSTAIHDNQDDTYYNRKSSKPHGPFIAYAYRAHLIPSAFLLFTKMTAG